MRTLIRPAALAFALACLGTAIAPGEAEAGYIAPVAVAANGPVTQGSPSVIIDGVTPPRFTVVTSPAVVSWNSPATSFTIDLGAIYSVATLTAALDNNDDYLIKSSTDGVTFANLFTFLAPDGPVMPGQGGLDLLTTDSSFPTSVGPNDTTTPVYVGRGFAATGARYLQVSAINGDSVYGIGELDAFTANAAAVPEPSSIVLTGIAALAGFGHTGLRRRMKAAARPA